MPQYLAKAKLFLGLYLIEPGEVFESDLPPGRNWEPVDDEAKARCVERDKTRGAVNAAAQKMDPVVTEPDAIPIPEDWLDMRPSEAVRLSRRLGAARNNNYVQAIGFIEKQIARRNEQAAQLQGAA